MEGCGLDEDTQVDVWCHYSQGEDCCRRRSQWRGSNGCVWSLWLRNQQVGSSPGAVTVMQLSWWLLFPPLWRLVRISLGQEHRKTLKKKKKKKKDTDRILIMLIALFGRWSPFPELPQERSSVNLVSCDGVLYAVGGFAIVENENKECAPSEMTDIWQYVFFFSKSVEHYWIQNISFCAL